MPDPDSIIRLRTVLARPGFASRSMVQAGASPRSTAGSRARLRGGRKKNRGGDEAEYVERLPGGKRGFGRQP